MNSLVSRAVLAFVISFFSIHTFAQNFSTGLKLANPDQLLGIPLASTPFSGNSLKTKVDLSPNMPAPGSQGNQNSCVGWAIAYSIKSYQEKIEEGNNFYDYSGNVRAEAVFSPAYIYNQVNQGQDGGCYIVDALNVVSQQGVVTWADMPYNEKDYLTKPTQTHKNKAKRYRIDFYRQVNVRDVKEVKAQLQAGYPVIIGARIDQGFAEDGMNNPKYIWTHMRGNQLGGHAMTLVGYDDSKSAFKVMNSWGSRWGSKGYGWISYNIFSNVVSEGYVLKDAINGPGPTDNPIVDNPNNELTDPDDLFDNNTDNTTNWLDEYVDIKPTDYLTTQFLVNNVQHNIVDYNFQLGQNGMRFDGSVNIPAGFGWNYQVVIYIYADDGYGNPGQQIASLDPSFSDIGGFSAAFTQRASIPRGQAINAYWTASLPYQSLYVYRGQYNIYGQYVPYQSNLIAQPVLYVDDFIVQYGTPYRFWVKL
ncbi:MAG: C1 family peptidase [Bacteroidota bacterium]